MAMRLWPALSPRQDLFALRAVPQLDFGCWSRLKRSPSQAQQAATRLSIRCWS
jgi:hypothetical protein